MEIKGVTLKHVIDEIIRHKPIPQFDGSTQQPWHKHFHEDAGNFNLKVMKESTWPAAWSDWNTKCKVADLPLILEEEVDLEHVVKTPAPMQPGRTSELAEYRFYLVSNEKVIVFIRSNGRGYTFCNRFHPEQILIFTQSGSTMEDVKVKFEARGRFNVLKSLMGFEGEIKRNGKSQTEQGYMDAVKNLDTRLQASFQKRILLKTDRSEIDPLIEIKALVTELQHA